MGTVSWSGIWVGALSALVSALVFGLIGIALGAQQVGPAQRIVSWNSFGLSTLVFSVFSAFFSLVIGGWVAGRVAGLRRSEPAMLHGAIVWLVVVPLLVALASLGAGGYFGGWIAGLAGSPAWAASPSGPADPNAAIVARNGALGAVTALLLGLVGGVIGGGVGAGEPMTFTHYRTREQMAEPPSPLAR